MPKKDDDKYRLSVEGLVNDLTALGVQKGDVIMMHSSLRSLAPVKELLRVDEGGMPMLMEAFRQVLGTEGLLAVPTFSATFASDASGPTGDPYNPKTTPSRVGDITNFIRKQPDAVRSEHPTHSIVAIGSRAEEFCSGHSWREGATTFDRKGPWGKLVDWDGKILWIGTDMRTQTMVHIVEEWMELPYLSTEKALVDDNGETKVVEVTQSPSGPRDFYKKDSKSSLAWDRDNISKRGQVCKAKSQIMGAQQFYDWMYNTLLEDPCILLGDGDDEWSVKARKDTIAHIEKLKQAKVEI